LQIAIFQYFDRFQHAMKLPNLVKYASSISVKLAISAFGETPRKSQFEIKVTL
jgi:hypothetical protein